jgi:two-component system osmolarity sensor histidine kinase EnvZ
MAENLARLESERTLLLAGVSHDLRTPLTRLRLAIDVAEIDPPLAQRMIANIEEIDRTIGQFLDFARGENSLQRESCAINALVERVAARYTLHGAQIALDLQPLPEIAAHEPTLERALSNLIDNALRYAGAEREIVLATRNESGRIVITVGDRGPGIPASQRERVKQAFVRLDAARGGATGAGLGLSIVERIARAHGGTLTLTGREGGGTLAELSLPLDQSAAYGRA